MLRYFKLPIDSGTDIKVYRFVAHKLSRIEVVIRRIVCQPLPPEKQNQMGYYRAVNTLKDLRVKQLPDYDPERNWSLQFKLLEVDKLRLQAAAMGADAAFLAALDWRPIINQLQSEELRYQHQARR